MAKSLVGVVTSDKPDKSIVVTVTSKKTHPIYKKQYNQSKRFMAHDEKNEARVGDKVQITETRPLSARKRHELTKVIVRAKISADNTVEAIAKEEAQGADTRVTKKAHTEEVEA